MKEGKSLKLGGMFLADTKNVKAFIAGLQEIGCEVTLDLKAGTAEATDGNCPVYKASRMERQPWCVRLFNSGRIEWKHS